MMKNYFTASDGAKISYVDMGQGPTLFYVHAFGESIAAKMPFFRLLGKHFRVVSFDQRGYGGTPAEGRLSLGQSAQDAKELMEHLGLADVCCVGYSMGAAVLFDYVRQFGTLNLARMAIIDMSPCLINEAGWVHGLHQGHYTHESYHKDLEMMERDFKGFNISFLTETVLPNQAENERDLTPTEEKYDALKSMFEMLPGGAEALVELPANVQAVRRAYWISMCENDFRPVLPKIDKPLAIIYARPGSLYDEATALHIASQVQVPRLYPIENATHMLGLTHADCVASVLLSFYNCSEPGQI